MDLWPIHTLTKSTENGEPKQQPTAHDCLTQVVFSAQWTNTSEGKQNRKHFVVVVESHVVHFRFSWKSDSVRVE